MSFSWLPWHVTAVSSNTNAHGAPLNTQPKCAGLQTSNAKISDPNQIISAIISPITQNNCPFGSNSGYAHTDRPNNNASPNFFTSVPPVMDVDKLDRLLNSYDPLIHSWLIQGLKLGFDLGYCREYTNIMVENLKSARSRPAIMSPLVEKEVINNRFLGPFSSPPFENFRVNALGFVPKKTPNEYRLIVDLSTFLRICCGAIFGQEFFSIEWPPPVPRENLTLLEFYPIILASIVWARKMQNLKIKILCDNFAVVHIINNLKSKDVTTMKLVRIFTLQCLIHNIHKYHLPGKDNHGPDALSRGQLERFATLYPSATQYQHQYPTNFSHSACSFRSFSG